MTALGAKGDQAVGPPNGEVSSSAKESTYLISGYRQPISHRNSVIDLENINVNIEVEVVGMYNAEKFS